MRSRPSMSFASSAASTPEGSMPAATSAFAITLAAANGSAPASTVACQSRSSPPVTSTTARSMSSSAWTRWILDAGDSGSSARRRSTSSAGGSDRTRSGSEEVREVQHSFWRLGRPRVGWRADRAEGRAAGVEAAEGGRGAADPAGLAADVDRLRGVLLEVGANDPYRMVFAAKWYWHLAVYARW